VSRGQASAWFRQTVFRSCGVSHRATGRGFRFCWAWLCSGRPLCHCLFGGALLSGFSFSGGIAASPHRKKRAMSLCAKGLDSHSRSLPFLSLPKNGSGSPQTLTLWQWQSGRGFQPRPKGRAYQTTRSWTSQPQALCAPRSRRDLELNTTLGSFPAIKEADPGRQTRISLSTIAPVWRPARL